MERTVVLVLLVTAVLAGCPGPGAWEEQAPGASPATSVPSATDGPTQGWPYGQVVVAHVKAAPAGAPVVNYSSSAVAESDLLESGFESAGAKQQWGMELTESRWEALNDSLADVPRYDGRRPGYYVRFEGDVYRISLLVYA